MLKIFTLILTVLLFSCESQGFDSDKRQIIAKDTIRKLIIRPNTLFDVESFKQDTLTAYPDTLVRLPIQYTLNFTYQDSLGHQIHKTAKVLFPPNGNSIISATIVEPEITQ